MLALTSLYQGSEGFFACDEQPNIDEKRAYQEAAAVFDGEVIIGQDLQTIE
ncbi:hypothetical protein [Bacillus piscicola]|uniref:hypothetical protein n=1 Tax=Bacillus piscicola TaxID=1632684 RepID=UPI001F09441F|nr:hypothetical protein [Bacillus piscicola]